MGGLSLTISFLIGIYLYEGAGAFSLVKKFRLRDVGREGRHVRRGGGGGDECNRCNLQKN